MHRGDLGRLVRIGVRLVHLNDLLSDRWESVTSVLCRVAGLVFDKYTWAVEQASWVARCQLVELIGHLFHQRLCAVTELEAVGLTVLCCHVVDSVNR